MGKCRLVAKGEKIVFDTEEGPKEYIIRPLINSQLLEITQLAEQPGKGMESALLMAKFSLNRSPNIVNGTEASFDDEEMKNMEAPFLFELLKKAAKINGMDDMFDFQLREGNLKSNEKVSLPKSREDIIQRLNANPRVKLS